VIRQTQSRTGERGTCFRTALASMLNLRENQVPDFPEANLDPGVNKFLRQYGLRYEETDDEPVGLYFMLGLSPRGGQHAVIGENGKRVMDPHPQDGTGRGLKRVERYGVLLPTASAKDANVKVSCPACGKQVKLVQSEYLSDKPYQALALHMTDPGDWRRNDRPLKSVKCTASGWPYEEAKKYYANAWRIPGLDSRLDCYSMLQILDALGIDVKEFMRRTLEQRERLPSTAVEKLDAMRRAHAKDALVGKRLHTAAEALRAKHDEIKADSTRAALIGPGVLETMWHATYQPIVNLVAEATKLLSKTRLDGDPEAWKSKLDSARRALVASKQAAQIGDWLIAVQKQEYALTMVHTVIDEMRSSSGRAKDEAPVSRYAREIVSASKDLSSALRLTKEYVDEQNLTKLETVVLVDKVRSLMTPSAPAGMSVKEARRLGMKARDADLRIGVTKCQQCGAKLNGDDVAEIGRKVVCPECADKRVRKAEDEKVTRLDYLQADELARQALKKYGNGSPEHTKAAEKAIQVYLAWRASDPYKVTDSAKRQRLHRALDAVMDKIGRN
jgi:hypothetical protein